MTGAPHLSVVPETDRLGLLDLQVPRAEEPPAGPASPQALAQWLDELPQGNALATARQLVAHVSAHNRQRWPAASRLTAAEQVRSVCEETVAALRAGFRTTAIPLPPRAAELADLVRTLEWELACAYKLALTTLVANPDEGDGDSPRLLALYRSVELLAQLVVDTYRLYGPEPRPLWGELHRLYRYAELNRLHRRPVTDGGPTVEHAYKRVVLLALADPYQLMQQEAGTVYRWLGLWAGRCPMEPVPALSPVAGRFYVDLDSDRPPRYAPRELECHPANPRVLDCVPLLAQTAGRIAALARADEQDGRPITPLHRRLERDLLVRLRDAWGGPRDRAAARQPSRADVEIAAGLSASHHFLSTGRAFTPEQDEVSIHRRELGRAPSGLSLLPMEDEPWRAQEEGQRLETGVERPRQSVFDDASADLDIWQKIYSTTGGGDSPGQTPAPAYEARPWHQKNASAGGMCLSCRSDGATALRVGELVVFQEPAGDGLWRVGAVRWLCDTPDERLEMGIEALADSATPLAIRSVHGTGEGGEYFRALRLPAGDVQAVGGSLVVPAAIYDTATVAVLNLGERLVYVRLTRLLETTRSYSRFEYELAEQPASERERIQSLRRLL